MQKKVLVVDDESSLATLIADFVGLLGGESKVLTGGQDVVKTVKVWKPDLVTLDIMMPHPNGIEVLNLLKNDPETRDTPVYVVSVGANMPEYSERLAHAEKKFEKPQDIQLLTKDLESIVRSQARVPTKKIGLS